MTEEELYKVGQVVEKEGQYQCSVCGHVIELKAGDVFKICPVCQAGSEGGPKGPNEGVWQYLEG